MRLLLVDGTNLIMRCAFGGEIAPADAVPTATNMLHRAAREARATHAVIAFDAPDWPTWRAELFDGYKADRKGRGGHPVGEYIALAGGEWARAGWSVQIARGFEADDIIATVVHRLEPRFREGSTAVVILSGDSDLQSLVTDPAVEVLRPVNGGAFERMRQADVCKKHGVMHPRQLPELKALAGEPGDSIPGPFGKKCIVKARKLLDEHGAIDDVFPTLTLEQLAIARRAWELVQLRTDVPIPQLTPKACALPQTARAA